MRLEDGAVAGAVPALARDELNNRCSMASRGLCQSAKDDAKAAGKAMAE